MKVARNFVQQGIVNFLEANEAWLRPLLTERIFDGVDLQAEAEKVANPDLHYPEYYLQDFHSVDGGYLNKDAAITYDPITNKILFPSETYLRTTLAQTFPKDVSNVLDLGCGTGTATRFIAEHLPHAHITGIDLSPYMIAAAKLKARSFYNITFLHANAEHLPFEDNSFDAVTASLLFHELPPSAGLNVMREALRVLKPNGVFIVFDGAQSSELSKIGGHISSMLFLEPYAEDFLKGNLTMMMREAGFIKAETIPVLTLYEIRRAYKAA
jgi:ubiquinone/menaquinone biosynthesis C-methylase UbiE